MSPAGACLWRMRSGKDTLLLLPHAGGSAQSYATWASWFPDDLGLLAAQYPGRGSRDHEPMASRLGQIVDELDEALADLEGPLYVFGHSMGSYVGFELAWKRQAAGRPPAAFFASGAVPPHRHRPEMGPGTEISDEQLLRFMDRCDGVLDEIMEIPEIRAQVLATLGADLMLFNDYLFGERQRKLVFPIVAFCGERDGVVPAFEFGHWHELAAAECATHLMDGGHFYFADDMAAFMATLSKYLANVRAEQTE